MRRFLKILQECPVMTGIVITAVLLSIVSFLFKDTAYARYSAEGGNLKVPVISLAFKGMRDGVFPWTAPMDDTAAPDDALYSESTDGAETDGGGDETDIGGQESGEGEEEADTSDLPRLFVSGNSSFEEEEEEEEEEEITYEFTEVDDDYFSDALFIGDSRTVGLSEYCEPLDERATFYSKVSLTIFDVMNKEFIKTDDGKMNVETALSENQFGKIYIMLGLNEAGTGDAGYFREHYKEVIDRICELQPDAIIYIQSIMHVTGKKSESDRFINNENINGRNEAIAELADQKRIFYLDMNEAVDDENGDLDSSLSFDGVHLKASSYQRWYEFLLHNAIVR